MLEIELLIFFFYSDQKVDCQLGVGVLCPDNQ